MYITTINIVGDVPGIRVVSMTGPVTGCLHDYQLTPDDVKRLSDAEVFVVNGAGMEARYTTSAPFIARPRPFSG
ncbi:MAG: metal ABC transporter substrate-binding protein [Dehalococcoidia bacterium]|nr:metal ABC transporter substrate-binding protein [Dehalococcoidia bacterium]